MCGYLACDAGLIRPVLAGLPRVVRVHLRNDRAGEWLRAVDPARRRARPGGGAGQRRHPRQARGGAVHRGAAALRDAAAGGADRLAGRRRRRDRRPQPGRAAPSPRASVDARRTRRGSRRFAFGADRALRPLSRARARWPISPTGASSSAPRRCARRAAACCRSPSEVGYESEAAFNRAFKRKFGSPPAQYRRASRAKRSAEAAPAGLSGLTRRQRRRRRRRARSRPGCARRRRCRW